MNKQKRKTLERRCAAVKKWAKQIKKPVACHDEPDYKIFIKLSVKWFNDNYVTPLQCANIVKGLSKRKLLKIWFYLTDVNCPGYGETPIYGNHFDVKLLMVMAVTNTPIAGFNKAASSFYEATWRKLV